MRARTFLRGITPPFLAAVARRGRAQRSDLGAGWEYLGTTWVEGGDTVGGWDDHEVARCYEGKLDAFRDAIAAPNCIGVPTEAILGCTPTPYDQNVAMGYAYAVARAARGRQRIAILDWGGGFGFMAFVVRELFPELDIDFHVKEVPATAAAARKHVHDVTFWSDESCLDQSYDLVTACSALQYSADWRVDLTRLGGAGRYLLLTRTPVTLTPRSYVVRQHAYGTSYSGWVFSRGELLFAADAAGLSLERELLEGWSAGVDGAPARDEARGYLFSNSRATGVGAEPPV